ncbi:MAG: nucleotidyltransferase family protein [Pyrinomonadaceae bacterium]
MRANRSRADLIVATLSGAWRRPPFPPLDVTEKELDEVTPLLYTSWAAALAWWRVRHTKLANSASGDVLRQAYHLNSVQAMMHEENIKKVFRLLREASIEAVLVKGWAAAALYPSPPLRPYGDLDICVSASDFKAARELLRGPEVSDCLVDLHQRFSELDDRSLPELFARARRVRLGNEQIQILCPEDHLALLALHLLKHGAWRPLWLCDISAAIESLPAEFDWNMCLGTNQTRANWIICALGLTNRLLGASIDSLPLASEARRLPPWLVANVRKHWANLFPGDHLPIKAPPLMVTNLRSPRNLLRGLRERWPDPITATYNLNGQFNRLPRPPYQLAEFASRAAQFLWRLPGTAQTER